MSTFAITPGSDTVALVKGKGEVTFTVSNSTGAGLRARAAVKVAGAANKAWFEVASPERDLTANGATTYTIGIEVPATTPAGDYKFQLSVVATHNPDETETLSGSVGFKFAPAEKAFPWIPIVASAAAVLIIAIVAFVVFRPRSVAVPALVDLTIAEARQQLADLGLTVEEELAVGAKEENIVVALEPAAGTEVEKGAVVRVTYEAPFIEMPRLLGQGLESAAQQLVGSALVVGDLDEQRQNPSEAGKVVVQSVAPGTRVRQGTTVSLTAEAPLVTIPDLRGRPATEALAQLGDLGLGANMTTVREDANKAGLVLSHVPGPSALVQRGATLDMKVEESRISVPSLVGKAQAEAKSAVEALGLKAAVATPAMFPVGSVGTVGATVPPVGTPVLAGETVHLVPVGKSVIVPNLIGKTQTDADKALKKAKLKPEYVTQLTREHKNGTVVDLTPSENTAVLEGASVKVSVASNRVPVVTIPWFKSPKVFGRGVQPAFKVVPKK